MLNAIIEGSQFGYGTPIGSFYPPGDPAYVDLTAQSNYDPEKSKQLLAEAGRTDSGVQRFTLFLFHPS